MKKALALVLTFAMLLSCVAISASAARVWTKEEKVLAEDTVTYSESNGIYSVENALFSGDYILNVTIKGSTAEFGKAFETVGYLEGSPVINAVNGTISFQGAPSSVSYTFADDTWYNVQFKVVGDTTTVFVNGAEVGSIAKYMRPLVYGTMYRCWIGEFIYTDLDGNFKWGDDFEDGTDDLFGGTIDTYKVTETVITNDNVAMSKDTVTYSESNGIYGSSDAFFGGDYVLTMTIKGSVAEFGKEFETVGYIGGSPVINGVNDTISFNGAPSTLSYDFKDETWYKVEFKVVGDTTTVYVDGAEVGSIAKYMQPMVYGTMYRCWIGECVMRDLDGNFKWGDDFEDETDDLFGGTITEVFVEGARRDLGTKYWNCQYYFDPDFNVGEGEDFELDVMFDPDLGEGSACTNVFISGPKFDLDAGTIGVNGATVDFSMKKGEWYHVLFENNGSSTDIYVDDAFVGTVNAVIGDLCFNGMGMCIDNLKVGDRFEDFEDGEWQKKGSSSGAIYEYDFTVAPPVDPYTILDNGAAEGDAKMFTTNKADGGTSYFYNPGDYPDVKSSKTVYAFDLALVPNDANGLDEAGKTWFGIWRDTGSKRFKVGYDVNNTQMTGFAGEGDAVVGFDWGEFTATNFHDVIIVFKGTKAAIYVDGVLLYEGAAGAPGINGSGATLFEVVNGTAIVDNFKVYAPDTCELLYDGFGSLSSNGNFNKAYDWTIGADCATNPHIYGETKRTTEPTCYSTGVDTRYCALCGEAMKEDTVGMIPHRYAKFDMNRVENGMYYTYCQNSGCTEKFYSAVPEYEYEGKMHAYFDMSDAFLAKLADGSEGEPYYGDALVYENGQGYADERAYPGNYTKWSIPETISDRVEGKDQSLTFDFTYLGTWDTDDNINSKYPHQLVFFLCGSNAVWLDFNFDENAVKIYGNQFAGFKIPEETVSYNFVEGTKYDVQITYHQYDTIIEGSEWVDDNGELQYETELACDLYVLINGEVVIAYDYENYYDLNYTIAYADGASQLSAYYIRNFGVKYAIDNLVVGTSDFKWTGRSYVGDVDGNNYLEANDALCMRKFLAKVIDDSALCTSRMDANGDGEVNAKDQLFIRKALAA